MSWHKKDGYKAQLAYRKRRKAEGKIMCQLWLMPEEAKLVREFIASVRANGQAEPMPAESGKAA